MRYFESRWRGYLFCEVTPGIWRTDLRIVDSVEDVAAAARNLTSFYMEDGRPGAQT